MALVAVLGGLLVGMVAATPLLFGDTVGAGAVQRQWDRACPADVEPHVEGTGMRALFGADDALLARVVGGLAAFGPVDVVAESGAMTLRNKAPPGPGRVGPRRPRLASSPTGCRSRQGVRRSCDPPRRAGRCRSMRTAPRV